MKRPLSGDTVLFIVIGVALVVTLAIDTFMVNIP